MVSNWKIDSQQLYINEQRGISDFLLKNVKMVNAKIDLNSI